jgi:CubicO group peptidase (beta-lactamase class C family)
LTPSLAQLADRLDTAVDRLRATHRPDEPGFALALIAEGQVLRQVTHGMAHLEWQQPITADTRFYLASESKPWTAALMLACVAAGRISLDEDVRARLPALQSYEQAIRLGHLLRHTSGVADYLGLWHAQLGRHEHDVVTQAQALELIRLADDVRFTPGSRFEYSNSNYVLLAELLRQLEGCSLAELARRRCFGPWGLLDSSFEEQPGRVMQRRARSYESEQPQVWLDAPVPLASWGDGGLWSSLSDLTQVECRWQAQGPNGSDYQFLLGACLQEDPRFAPADAPYRFGLEVLRHGAREFAFHGGGYAGFSAMLLRCLGERSSLLLLSNRDGLDTSTDTWLEAIWGNG